MVSFSGSTSKQEQQQQQQQGSEVTQKHERQPHQGEEMDVEKGDPPQHHRRFPLTWYTGVSTKLRLEHRAHNNSAIGTLSSHSRPPKLKICHHHMKVWIQQRKFRLPKLVYSISYSSLGNHHYYYITNSNSSHPFHRISPIVALGYRRPIVAEDLWKLDHSRLSSHAADQLVAAYDKREQDVEEYNASLDRGEIKKKWYQRKPPQKQRPTLLQPVLDVFARKFLLTSLIKIASDGILTTSPFVTK